MNPLLREHFAHDGLDQRAIDWLHAQGVPYAAMVKPSSIRKARVVFENGSFDRDPEGRCAFTFLIEDCGDVVDLVAWQPKTGHLAAYAGRAFALGQEAIYNPGTYSLGGALRVHRSPLSWLRAERDGIVILNPAGGYAWLGQVPRIAAEDTAHSQELWALIEPPRPQTQINLIEKDAA